MFITMIRRTLTLICNNGTISEMKINNFVFSVEDMIREVDIDGDGKIDFDGM